MKGRKKGGKEEKEETSKEKKERSAGKWRGGNRCPLVTGQMDSLSTLP